MAETESRTGALRPFAKSVVVSTLIGCALGTFVGILARYRSGDVDYPIWVIGVAGMVIGFFHALTYSWRLRGRLGHFASWIVSCVIAVGVLVAREIILGPARLATVGLWLFFGIMAGVGFTYIEEITRPGQD